MKFRKYKRERALDFELNLASVIDCLVVLIAFVLISASFASVGILEGSVASSAADSKPQEAQTEMVVSLKKSHDFEVTVVGKKDGKPEKRAYVIAGKSTKETGDWNYSALTDRLAFIKGEWPELKSAVLIADNGIAYRDVVKAMEITRLAVPSILLGGF
jgi:biopolymer transport protein ExbD